MPFKIMRLNKSLLKKISSFRKFIKDLWPLLGASFSFWAIIPGLYFGNLHTDTLEAIYWGHDLAWGYSKHPPVLTWILSTIVHPGLAAIFIIVAFGQLAAALTSYYVYFTVMRIADRPTAIVASCLMMLSSTAAFYSVQVNHNSILVPFCAAALYYGLEFLEERRLWSAIWFSLAVGLGALTKYEIVFALVPLIALCLSIPRYRTAFLSWGTVISIVIVGSMILPHLIWQWEHDWVSVARATSSAHTTDIWSLVFGFYGIAVGLLAVLGCPIILLMILRRRSKTPNNPNELNKKQKKIGKILLFSPISAVVVAGAVTDQFIKALWMLPLAPSLIAGLALINPFDCNSPTLNRKTAVSSSIKVSMATFILYLLYLFIGEVIDNPAESYLANTRPLSVEAEQLWSLHSEAPLKCVVTDEAKLAPSAVLWMASHPQILPIYVTDWATPKRLTDCAETGGVAIKFEIDEPFDVAKKFANACVNEEVKFHVDTVSRLSRTGWNATLTYIPPNDHPACSK
jgi:4-amino-4-deoxy-L-arabinose transferase-like glycosyltransferase